MISHPPRRGAILDARWTLFLVLCKYTQEENHSLNHALEACSLRDLHDLIYPGSAVLVGLGVGTRAHGALVARV
jgi:hypothetical protein